MLVDNTPGKVADRLETVDPPRSFTPLAPSRFAGLDGLRALAVTAVVLFHADFYWARGGYLGVDLFFVISGFLITSLIAREVEATGRLNLGAFYWRRARRLLPASLLMAAVVVIAAAGLAPDALPRLRRDVVASLAYVTNWELLHSKISYFDTMGRPPLMQHLWSLAIEEQFYLLWAPLSLFVLPRFGPRRLAVVAVLTAVASVVTMGWLATSMGYPERGDPSRLYFGTDTHGFSLLTGAAFGLRRRPLPGTGRAGFAARMIGWLLGLTALGNIIFLFARMGEDTPLLYPWGFLVAAATGVVLVATATHPGIAFGRLLDNAPMRWLGARSYSIYLWHWPVFMMTRPGTDLPELNDDFAFVLRLCLTLALAECSYRYVETPVRMGFLERYFVGARARSWPTRLSVVSATLATVCAVTAILRNAPAQALPAQDVREAFGMAGKALPAPSVERAVVQAVSPVVHMVSNVSLETTEPKKRTQPEERTFSGNELTVVGDSVMLGSRRLLKSLLPGNDLHATMGWQAADVIRQLQTLKDSQALRAVVLVHLGTNGYVTEDQLRRILGMLSSRERVILVNTRVPRRWMEPNNALIDRVAPDFPNVRVVRWSDLSEKRPGYFISDKVHLTAMGQRALIADVMRVGRLKHHTRSLKGDTYWYKIAQCETDADWHDETRLLGGLNIGLGAWIAWGGGAFAPTPSQATPAQQIDVANRISTQGWKNAHGDFVKPIGFDHWGCIATAGLPPSGSAAAFALEGVPGA
jgi:peptidoglycan/LPS O-acetylase OafA/YrhL